MLGARCGEVEDFERVERERRVLLVARDVVDVVEDECVARGVGEVAADLESVAV